jgi:pilus assembly protein CpaB
VRLRLATRPAANGFAEGRPIFGRPIAALKHGDIPMRLSSIFMALVGLAVAGGSAQLAREMLMAPQADAAAQPAVVQAVVAAADIKRGDVIQPQMLATQNWPADAVPPGTYIDMAALLPAEPGGEPRRAMRPIGRGELIMAGKVSDFGQKVTIVDSLAPGTRAVSIRVDAVTSVGGFVTPGDFVDVLLTRGSDSTLITDTILRKVRVVAVDQSSDELQDSPALVATVTVEATPDESQILALAQKAGTLSLALRDPDAPDTAPVERLRLSDLVPEEPVVVETPEAPAVVEAPVRKPTILVRRGTDSEEEVTLRD